MGCDDLGSDGSRNSNKIRSVKGYLNSKEQENQTHLYKEIIHLYLLRKSKK